MAFVRLQTRLHSEQSEEAFALRREVYDVLGKRFIAAFETALPNIDVADINWRFVFVVGASLYMIADVDRLTHLSSGRFDANDVDEVSERLLSFCNGGFMAPSTAMPSDSARRATHSRRTPKAARPKQTEPASGEKSHLRR